MPPAFAVGMNLSARVSAREKGAGAGVLEALRAWFQRPLDHSPIGEPQRGIGKRLLIPPGSPGRARDWLAWRR
jgi:hypothetical protein